ncbi:MAG: hypothetical protein ACLTS6_07425 [Anaerobutyricum sp.]
MTDSSRHEENQYDFWALVHVIILAVCLVYCSTARCRKHENQYCNIRLCKTAGKRLYSCEVWIIQQPVGRKDEGSLAARRGTVQIIKAIANKKLPAI